MAQGMRFLDPLANASNPRLIEVCNPITHELSPAGGELQQRSTLPICSGAGSPGTFVEPTTTSTADVAGRTKILFA